MSVKLRTANNAEKQTLKQKILSIDVLNVAKEVIQDKDKLLEPINFMRSVSTTVSRLRKDESIDMDWMVWRNGRKVYVKRIK